MISKATLISSSGSICEICETYSDGCNRCTCTDTTSFGIACTQKACPYGNVEDPGCRSCRDGYSLNLLTYECESNICGGIENCATFSKWTIFFYFFIFLRIVMVCP